METNNGRGKPLILVVDDNEAIQDLLARTLEHFGAETVCAQTTVEALKHVQTHHDALRMAFLDHHLAEGTTQKVAQTLRSDFGPQFPIVKITGGLLPTERTNDGICDAVLMKPWTLETLRNLLRNFLKDPTV